MKKRNNIKFGNSGLEPKVMLAAAAPETIELGPSVGAEAQAATNFSAATGVEVGVGIDADGNSVADTVSVGTADGVFLTVPEDGGTVHSHPSSVFEPDGDENSVFVNTDGLPVDGEGEPVTGVIPDGSAVIPQPPGEEDIALSNFRGETFGVVASGDTTFAHVPSEEGVRSAQTDIQSQQDFDVKVAQSQALTDNSTETGFKRAQAEADRTGGQVSEERAGQIIDNAAAQRSEAAGGTLFRGENDGSGSFTEVQRDPSIS